ncbi:2024_t:CDS:2 [Entrophospora sp. SA101]|nr:2024_t:CDS:2 [Entrophospora sp. SA101]
MPEYGGYGYLINMNSVEFSIQEYITLVGSEQLNQKLMIVFKNSNEIFKAKNG